ncbi:MAG: hypothetical protein QN131_12285 [Armatimonadota bacterium]|nr:hypothetical protein [Armatimonadota bacterium]
MHKQALVDPDYGGLVDAERTQDRHVPPPDADPFLQPELELVERPAPPCLIEKSPLVEISAFDPERPEGVEAPHTVADKLPCEQDATNSCGERIAHYGGASSL